MSRSTSPSQRMSSFEESPREISPTPSTSFVFVNKDFLLHIWCVAPESTIQVLVDSATFAFGPELEDDDLELMQQFAIMAIRGLDFSRLVMQATAKVAALVSPTLQSIVKCPMTWHLWHLVVFA